MFFSVRCGLLFCASQLSASLASGCFPLSTNQISKMIAPSWDIYALLICALTAKSAHYFPTL
jgi:hypothetical protein